MAKPLKKQLEKFANESKLYLAVMFYISDVGQLHDEITRYDPLLLEFMLQLMTLCQSVKLIVEN